MDNRDLIRFYQQMSAEPLYRLTYRLKDSYGNKETLQVIFRIKGLKIVLRYSLYGGWEDSGTAYALTNLSKQTPPYAKRVMHITREIEAFLYRYYESHISQQSYALRDYLDELFPDIRKRIQSFLLCKAEVVRVSD